MLRELLIAAVAGIFPSALSAIQAADGDLLDLARATPLHLQQQARIGGYDDREPYVLSSVPDAAILQSREVAIVDYLSRELRIYDPDGSFLRRLGGPGDGPGEFGRLLGVAPISGNRLLLWDGDVARKSASIMTDEGQHELTRRYQAPSDLGTIEVITPAGEAVRAPAWIVQPQGGGFRGALASGQLLLQEARPPVMTAGSRTDTVRVVVYDLDAHESQVVGTAAGRRVTYEVESGIGRLLVRFFHRDAVMATLGNEIVFGSTGYPVLYRVTPTGQPLGVWRLGSRDRRVTEADIEAERARQAAELERWHSPEVAQERRGIVERTEWEDTLPAFGDILGGSDDVLWVADYPRPSSESVRWYRVEGGVASAWFDISRDAQVLDIAYGLVVHAEYDQLGVVTVVVSRLVEG